MTHTRDATASSLVTLTCGSCGVIFQRARWEQPEPGRLPACSRSCAAKLGRGKTGRPRTLPRVNGWVRYGRYWGRYDPASPYAGPNGQVLQHREVMGKALGRPLRPDEHVHHRNGDGLDNRRRNLQILSPSAHMKLTAAHRVAQPKRRIAVLEAELAQYRALYGPLPVPASPARRQATQWSAAAPS